MDIEGVTYELYGTTRAAWDGMYQAIKDAKSSIYWEVFIFIDDTAGQRFVDLLVEKAKAGVTVKMIIDTIGSREFSLASEKKLRAAGVDLLWYNRLYPSFNFNQWFWRVFSRNHRKVLVVDENIAFLGGVNVGESFSNWLDLYIRLEGDFVRPLITAFAKSYIAAGGLRQNVYSLLKTNTALNQWRDKIRFFIHSPRFNSAGRIWHWPARALTLANSSVNLVTPYFVPDYRFFKTLTEAIARGVTVNIYLPLEPDHKMMAVMGYWYMQRAARLGAHMFFVKTMHHGKAATIDDSIGIIGSANISRRGFWLDAEAGVEFSDTRMVAELLDIFRQFHENSVPAEDARLRPLSLFERVEQWVLGKFESYL